MQLAHAHPKIHICKPKDKRNVNLSGRPKYRTQKNTNDPSCSKPCDQIPLRRKELLLFPHCNEMPTQEQDKSTHRTPCLWDMDIPLVIYFCQCKYKRSSIPTVVCKQTNTSGRISNNYQCDDTHTYTRRQ